MAGWQVSYTARARQHLHAGYQFYKAIRPSLGNDFDEEVQAAINRILEHPDAWPPFGKLFRRVKINRFPYGILYRVEGETLYIVNIMHMSRHPRRWLG